LFVAVLGASSYTYVEATRDQQLVAWIQAHIETAPWIHPCYRGCLTLEIANVSNTPLILYPGRSIGQLILMELAKGNGREPKLSGTYLAPVYPEAPVFADPKEDLQKIGVPESDIKFPGHGGSGG
jgi:hypothetical protein